MGRGRENKVGLFVSSVHPVNPVTGLYLCSAARLSPLSDILALGYIYRDETKAAHGMQECLATEDEG